MGADLAVSTSEFEAKVINSPVPVLVDFWAEWCGPCKMIGPAIEELSAEYAGKASVYKVDVDREPDIAERFGVMTIPALLIFKEGKLVDRMVGAAPKPAIAQFLQRSL